MINLGQLDPDWQFAARHGKASNIGIPSPNISYHGSTSICPCCYQFIYKEQVPLCVNSKQLQFLGFGFPLFYSFMKNCIILLILLICSYSAISLKKAYDTTYEWCYGHASVHQHRLLASTLTSAPTCSTFMIQMTRIEQSISAEEDILRIVSFVLQLIFLIYMRDHITKLEHYYDERNTSLSDYSIMLKNIPKQKFIQMRLKQFFQKGFSRPHQIKQLTLLPQYPEIDQLKTDRQKIINQLRNSYDLLVLSEQDLINQENLVKIQQALRQEVEVSKQRGLKDQIECQKVIIVFNSDQQKTQIIQEFQNMNFASRGPFFGVGCQNITIKEAPEPKQILWENVHVSKRKKIMLFLLGWGLSLLTLVVVTIIFYLILQQKSIHLMDAIAEYEKNPDQHTYEVQYNGAVALVYILLILVMVFNKIIMASLFYKFTQIQKHQTRSKFQFSFGFKYLLGLFFTTALMTLAVQAIRFHNYYSHPYGVIQQQSIMFFLNAFFTPFFWLLNPFMISKYISKYFKFGKKGLTQGQANFIMQKPYYNIGKRYAEIIQTIWFTFLYSTLIPMGAVISIAGICLYYWVDKYTLLRKSSLGGQVSGRIVIPYMKLLDVTLILKPVGQLMFDVQIRHNSNNTSSIIMIVIGFIYILLPINKIINVLNPEMFKLEQKTYDEVKQTFKDTYHTEHPVYKLIAADKLKQKLIRKGLTFAHSINTIQNLVQNTINDQDIQFNLRRKSGTVANRPELISSDRKSSQASMRLQNTNNNIKRKATFSPRKKQHNPNIR